MRPMARVPNRSSRPPHVSVGETGRSPGAAGPFPREFEADDAGFRLDVPDSVDHNSTDGWAGNSWIKPKSADLESALWPYCNGIENLGRD